MTNWEKYFGSPELAARMRVSTARVYSDAEYPVEILVSGKNVKTKGAFVFQADAERGESLTEKYLEWLRQEAD